MRLTCEEVTECYEQIIGEIDIPEKAIGNARQSSSELGIISATKKDVKEVIKFILEMQTILAIQKTMICFLKQIRLTDNCTCCLLRYSTLNVGSAHLSLRKSIIKTSLHI